MEILAAGEWKSPAFLSYLSREELEDAVANDAHQGGLLAETIGDSSGEEEG